MYINTDIVTIIVLFSQDFYVKDASEGQVMVCVSHNSSLTNLYISEVNGFRFSLSLEKVVFYNPKSASHEDWRDFFEFR